MNGRAAAGLAALLAASACLASAPATSGELDANQVLRLAVSKDIETFDPSVMSQPGVEESLARNLFNGLYRYDDELRLVPDLAVGMPQVSADGLTWTFRIRPEAKFWNGDPVRAQDFLFSWNRAATRRNGDSYVFEPVAGFADVQSGKSATLTGLSTPDDHTVVARLAQPAGWWLTELALWPAWALDERTVRALGDESWWKTPEGLVGTGPFRMHSRVPGASMEFVPVPNWWGGSTGRLKRVHVSIVPDAGQQVAEYERGLHDLLGYAPASSASALPTETIQRYARDKMLSSQLLQRPWLRTTFLTFNVRSGAVAGDAGRPARRALSLAIDRDRYVRDTCDGGMTCQPATGGLIVKGLSGYLGDGRDANAAFNPGAAAGEYRAWDPLGSNGPRLRLLANSAVRAIALELQKQWQATLGITVELDVLDAQALGPARRAGRYEMFLDAWLADYDSPRDWFAFKFVDSINYANPRFNAVAARADAKLPDDARSDYQEAGRILVDDVAYGALAYLKGSYLVKPYVRGAGGNAMFENYWTSIKLLQH